MEVTHEIRGGRPVPSPTGARERLLVHAAPAQEGMLELTDVVQSVLAPVRHLVSGDGWHLGGPGLGTRHGDPEAIPLSATRRRMWVTSYSM